VDINFNEPEERSLKGDRGTMEFISILIAFAWIIVIGYFIIMLALEIFVTLFAFAGMISLLVWTIIQAIFESLFSIFPKREKLNDDQIIWKRKY